MTDHSYYYLTNYINNPILMKLVQSHPQYDPDYQDSPPASVAPKKLCRISVFIALCTSRVPRRPASRGLASIEVAIVPGAREGGERTAATSLGGGPSRKG